MDSEKIRYFFPKVKNRFVANRKRFWKHFDLNRISLRRFQPFVDIDEFKSTLCSILGCYDSDILKGISDEDRKKILTSADQALRHEFDLLGSGPIIMDPINWHTDFKCGAQWKKEWFLEIKYIKGADIKVPWELSRCQHLLWLGEAYLLTGQNCYAKEVVDEISWWIDDNPLMYTVNWTCAMDVSFRAVNWMFALNMISEYEGFNDTFVLKVSKSLWQHAFFIHNNLERQIPYSNNHYVSDLVGLLYLGAFFEKTTLGKSWLRFVLKEFYKEIRQQVLPSGVHYEKSVSYHRMMTEMISYPIYMLRRLGEEIPSDIIECIGRMYDYTAVYTKPNGLAPLIADNDDGRFIPFLQRDFRQHSYLNDTRSLENLFISAGTKPLFCSECKDGSIYEDAGVAIVHKRNDYLFFNNGGYSKRPKEKDMMIGTHTHNDLLSFELSLNRKDIIVDSGTYLYTSSIVERNYFRSTAKHNTVMVDGEEQNGFGEAFVLKRNVHIGKLRQLADYMYEGDYATINGKFHHLRRITFKEKQLVISDKLSKDGRDHIAKIYLHFAEGLLPNIVDSNVMIERIRVSFNIKPLLLEVIDDVISPSFGVLVKSRTAVATFSFDNDITIETNIQDYGQE